MQEYSKEWPYEHLEQLRQLLSLAEEAIIKKAKQLDSNGKKLFGTMSTEQVDFNESNGEGILSSNFLQ